MSGYCRLEEKSAQDSLGGNKVKAKLSKHLQLSDNSEFSAQSRVSQEPQAARTSRVTKGCELQNK